MKYLSLLITLILLVSVLVGCTEQPFATGTSQPTMQVDATKTLNSPTETPKTNGTSPTPSGTAVIKIWLPPEFYPTPGNISGEMLQNRLNNFMKLHPEIRVELREKALDGVGGMLDSLITASAAAPLALPDLVALPNATMDVAATKGLLQSETDFTDNLQNDDWYEYARQVPIVQNKSYGLPFAGDTQLLVYRPNKLETVPISWSEVLTSTTSLVFPAADPLAIFTLIQYQSLGGQLYDDEGRPFLDTDILTQILTFYQEAEKSGQIPYWLTRYESDEEIWQAYNEGTANVVATWASNYLQEEPQSSKVAPIPTQTGKPFTYASGWVWSVTSQDPIKRAISVDLAEYLTESQFLSYWSITTGFMPVKKSSINNWSDEDAKPILDVILSSAQVIPSPDTLAILGAPIKQAVVDILKEQSDPQSAAQKAANSLTSP